MKSNKELKNGAVTEEVLARGKFEILGSNAYFLDYCCAVHFVSND